MSSGVIPLRSPTTSDGTRAACSGGEWDAASRKPAWIAVTKALKKSGARVSPEILVTLTTRASWDSGSEEPNRPKIL